MNRNKGLSIMFWVFAVVAPFAVSLFTAALFPSNEEVPLHWNIRGEIDRWGSVWV